MRAGAVEKLTGHKITGEKVVYLLSGSVVHSTQTRDLHTIANTGGEIKLSYRYQGYHAWAQVRVFLNAYVTHNALTTVTPLVNLGPVWCCDYPSGGFSESGSVTLNVQAGDTYGFKFGGSNGDSDTTLLGTFSILPKVGIDFDADMKTDIAVYRASTGAWYIKPASGASPYGFGWGGDISDMPLTTNPN